MSRRPLPPPAEPPPLREVVPLPSYRYVPGLLPHPHKHAGGHRHAPDLAPDALWRHGLDLFDHRFYWECHEVLEGRWKALPKGDLEREALQGIIQAAAAVLQHHMGHPRGAQRLLQRATARLERAAEGLGGAALGLDLRAVAPRVQATLDGGDWPVLPR